MANKFRCPDGHEFEANRNFYAHCPVCSKNSRRLYDETNSSTDGATETDESKNKKVEEVANKATNEGTEKRGVRKVVVRRAKKTPNKKTTQTSTTRSTKSIPAKTGTGTKKIVKPPGTKPVVKKRVHTTRERAQEQKTGPKQESHWGTFGKVSGFKQ